MRTDCRIAIRAGAGLRALAFAAVAAIVLQLYVLPHQQAAYDVVAASSDKLVHAAVFAVVASLLWIGTRGRWPLAILAAAGAIGLADEAIQWYSPVRHADVRDLLADLAGAALALFFLNRFARATPLAAPEPAFSNGG
jgi:VanZ family protein